VIDFVIEKQQKSLIGSLASTSRLALEERSEDFGVEASFYCLGQLILTTTQRIAARLAKFLISHFNKRK
jgi:hypothetical protein